MYSLLMTPGTGLCANVEKGKAVIIEIKNTFLRIRISLWRSFFVIDWNYNVMAKILGLKPAISDGGDATANAVLR